MVKSLGKKLVIIFVGQKIISYESKKINIFNLRIINETDEGGMLIFLQNIIKTTIE